MDGIAIAAGSWITTIIPIKYLKIVSGAVFIVFGLLMIINKKEDDEKSKSYKNPFISAFLLILIAEWGDKTQIAAALFATKYNMIMVLSGTIIALLILSIIAVFFGRIISDKISREKINLVAAIIFIIMGISFFFL